MDADTLATMITILVAFLGSSAVTIGTVLRQTNHLDTKFTAALQDLSGEVKDLSGEVKGLSGEVKDLSGEVKDLSGEVKGNSRRLDELSASSREQGRVLGDVRERLARVEGYLMPPGGITVHHTAQPGGDDQPDGDSGTGPQPEHGRLDEAPRDEREAG